MALIKMQLLLSEFQMLLLIWFLDLQHTKRWKKLMPKEIYRVIAKDYAIYQKFNIQLKMIQKFTGVYQRKAF